MTRLPGFVQAVAVDLDGTIASGHVLDAAALAALEDCRAAGTAVLLVTGRIESELVADFPGLLGRFDAAVLENGAVLASQGRRTVVATVDPLLAPFLRERGVPVRTGAGILACHGSDAHIVRDGIDALELDAQLMHNRAELVVVPSGVSKGTGLRAALADLGISAHNTVAIGDAENDISMLAAAEIGVAAQGSVDSVLRIADVALSGEPGRRLVDFLRGPVIAGAQPVHSARHDLRIGECADGSPVSVPGAQAGILVCGDTGSGKSHLAGLLVERWIGAGYTALVIDPEGDHSKLGELHQTVVVEGDEFHPIDEVVEMLCERSLSVVLDLSGMARPDVAPYLEAVASRIESVRGTYGLPHWIVIDEAHGVLAEYGSLAHVFRPTGGGYCYVTFRPGTLCAAARNTIDVTLTALGPTSDGHGERRPTATITTPGQPDRDFIPDPRLTTHVRHRNKYRDVALPDPLRFRFLDQSGKVMASAATMNEFAGAIRSVPDESILHHAVRGDFSRWAVGAVQDRALGAMLAAVENDCSARVSSAVKLLRRRAGGQLEQRYGIGDGQPGGDAGR